MPSWITARNAMMAPRENHDPKGKRLPLRLNVPAWNGGEIAAGLRALAGATADLEDLRRELADAVPGRAPILVRSARFGIALAVRALGLAGRRIAVPGYVCPAVLTGLRAAPAEAVPVDVEKSSSRFDLRQIRDVDAVLAANTYGIDQDFDALARLGLPVIEDAAYQAGRAESGGRGDAGVWSFNFKALTGVGGGVLWLPPGLAGPTGLPRRSGGETKLFLDYALRALLRHRIPAFAGGFAPPGPPANRTRPALSAHRDGALSPLQAAVALRQWRRRDELAARQRAASARIASAAGAFHKLPGQAPDAAVHLLPLLAATPDAALAARRHLYRAGIQTEDAYPIPFDDPLPHARDLAMRLFLVPIGPALGEDQLKRIALALETSPR